MGLSSKRRACNSGVGGSMMPKACRIKPYLEPTTSLLQHLDPSGLIGGTGLDLIVSPKRRSTFQCSSWVHSAQSHVHILDHRKKCNVVLKVCRVPRLEKYSFVGKNGV